MQGSVSIYAVMTVFIIQLLGAVDHWRVMKRDGRVAGTVLDYFLRDYPGHSFAAIIALGGTSWLAAISGAADFLNPETLYSVMQYGMINTEIAAKITGAVITSYGVGYAFDSKMNKAGEV